MDDDSSMKQKTWQVYNFGKKMFLGSIWMSPERVFAGEDASND